MPVQLQPPLDDRSSWSATGRCPVERAMEVVGSRCSMLLLREAYYGTTRFDDFVTRVDVAPATASAHLAALVEAGLLERRPYRQPGDRPRMEYQLTESGTDMAPAVLALYRWGMRHGGARGGIEFSHAECGEAIEVEVRCAAGHEVALAQVEARFSPRAARV